MNSWSKIPFRFGLRKGYAASSSRDLGIEEDHQYSSVFR